MDYGLKEGVRSIPELLRYLGVIGGTMLSYWMKKDDTDFGTFYAAQITLSKSIPPEKFLLAMDEQMTIIKDLFSKINEEDLFKKEITYPWSGEKASLGEGIIATSVKWLSAYKLQLFLFIKLTGDQTLATADAWVLTGISGS